MMMVAEASAHVSVTSILCTPCCCLKSLFIDRRGGVLHVDASLLG